MDEVITELEHVGYAVHVREVGDDAVAIGLGQVSHI